MEERLKMLQKTADTIRIECMKSIYTAGSGHIGGSFSSAEIMALLYFDKMKIDPQNPDKADRDRFILSKGHVAPVLYTTLALKGFFPTEELKTLRQLDSRLSGHPAYHKTPGVDMVSGSLGQGLAVGLGMRLSGMRQEKNFKTFVLMGDGEIQEGSVWESAMAAAHFKVTGLIGILDYNGVQLDGGIAQIMEVAPLAEKWKAFGWQVVECDGHNMEELDRGLARAVDLSGQGPVIIIASTIKGKGVSFMENKAEWHGSVPDQEQYTLAMKELEEKRGEDK